MNLFSNLLVTVKEETILSMSQPPSDEIYTFLITRFKSDGKVAKQIDQPKQNQIIFNLNF